MKKKTLKEKMQIAEDQIVALKRITEDQKDATYSLVKCIVGLGILVAVLFSVSIGISMDNNSDHVKEIAELKYRSMKISRKIKRNKKDISYLETVQHLLKYKSIIVKDCKNAIGNLKKVKHFKKTHIIGKTAYCSYSVCKNKMCDHDGDIEHEKIREALKVLGED